MKDGLWLKNLSLLKFSKDSRKFGKIFDHFNSYTLTVILTASFKNKSSCRTHSVMAVAAYFDAGYIPFLKTEAFHKTAEQYTNRVVYIGLLPGTLADTLWPKILFIFTMWPTSFLSNGRCFMSFTASLVTMHNPRMFVSIMWCISSVLLSSRIRPFVITLALLIFNLKFQQFPPQKIKFVSPTNRFHRISLQCSEKPPWFDLLAWCHTRNWSIFLSRQTATSSKPIKSETEILIWSFSWQ